MWRESNVKLGVDQCLANSHNFLNNQIDNVLAYQVVKYFFKLNKVVEEAIARFMNYDRMMDALIRLKANIDKMKVYLVTP